MEIHQNQPTTPSKSSFFDTMLFKIFLIGFITILLLIPSALIQELVIERQNRQTEVIKEVTDKWSTDQEIAGPVLVLPYQQTVTTTEDGKTKAEQIKTNIYILPAQLNVLSDVSPELLHRGIYDAVVYNAKIKIQGNFPELELKKSGINTANIDWKNARMVFGLSDLKGLKNNPTIQILDKRLEAEPEFSGIKLFAKNLSINPELENLKLSQIPFQFELDLRGSTSLQFLHLGKNTHVQVKGNWGNPSFTGRYLPDSRAVTNSEFNAQWKLPAYNRPYPQQWIEQDAILSSLQKTEDKTTVKEDQNAIFGVKFIPAVDQYQQTLRTAKYSFLVILLSFIALLFTEILLKKKIHIIQYILVGAAMTVYYALLLAFSEQIGFDWAYSIASIATLLLISTFIYLLFKNIKPAAIFAAILAVFYTFIYTIVQLQDLSILVGSIGLFVIIAVIMYLSAKMDWFKN
ncbi:cell envelope integrity protein CreD [Pedobacter flavus]|uniref:Cell envelope integrity protein CreD n=1 Tax=Pedobacter flavus TaxID=3113906 RepID=A0ABU7H2H5_9SPHI|nr:cell envelope integrity protein CreD [Pedobacter sp. VNH31]MEE1885506.1 cell envelope integrity protein CreD [Pedobacter sp. VNH31]